MDEQVSYQYNSEYQPPPPPPPQRQGVRDTSINYGVIGIIVICVAMMAWMYIDIDSTLFMMMWPEQTMPWMFVTSIFMHSGVNHLFWNMFMLYIFGMTLETIMGTKNFLALFLSAGIIGNVGYVFFCLITGSDIPAVGASGALYGMFACLSIIRPNMRSYLFFAIPMKIVHALILFAAIDIVFMSSNDNIAHAAHLAGLVAGLVFGFYLKDKLQKPQITQRHQNAPYR